MKQAPPIPRHDLDSAHSPDGFELSYWNEPQPYDFEKPHRHGFYEVILFFKGGGTHDIDFTTHRVRSRSVHFVKPDHVHLLLRSRNACGCSLRFTGDHIPAELIAALPFSAAAPLLHLSAADLAVVRRLTDLLADEAARGQRHGDAIIRAHLQALMLHLLRAWQAQAPAAPAPEPPELIMQFTQLVQRSFARQRGVEQYARELNVSAKHLIATCKAHTGQTPLQYINQHVVTEAKRLLYHTALPVKEIAFRLGFDEPANFSKFFKAATSYTPVAYREGIGK